MAPLPRPVVKRRRAEMDSISTAIAKTHVNNRPVSHPGRGDTENIPPTCCAVGPLNGKPQSVPQEPPSPSHPSGHEGGEIVGPEPAGPPSRVMKYLPKKGDLFAARYRVRSRVGQGSFGTVVHADDTLTGGSVAIKIFHKGIDIDVSSTHEEDMYHKIVAGCDPRVNLFAHVFSSGLHIGFHYTVFDLCQGTLFDILKGSIGVMPLPRRHIAEISYQLITAVQYLHSLNIVHTDLKPDNVGIRVRDTAGIRMLDPSYGFRDRKILVTTQICILDLGSAVTITGSAHAPSRIGTVGYRAPEIILGLPWSFAADVFSIGCIVTELYTGRNLFPAVVSGDVEKLAIIDRVVGPFPEGFAREVDRTFGGVFSFNGGRVTVKYPPFEMSPSPTHHGDALRRLQAFRPLSTFIYNSTLHDLLRQLMCPDPHRRTVLEVASRHKEFDELGRPEHA